MTAHHPDRVAEALTAVIDDGTVARALEKPQAIEHLIAMSDSPVSLAGVQPREVTVFVPFLPTTYLSPNRGERKEGRVPAIISEHKAQMRAETCVWLCAQPQVKAISEPFAYARVSVVLRWHKRASDGLYRPEDATNAVYSLKAFFDGVKDAGLIVDDDYKHMELGGARVERCDSPQLEGVVVTVSEVRTG